MSAIKDVLIDIADSLASGTPMQEIATLLKLPLVWVQDVAEQEIMNDYSDYGRIAGEFDE